MSKERIEYNLAPTSTRFVALIIDLIVGLVIDFFSYFGMELEYEILWSKLNLFNRDIIPYAVIVWFFIGTGIYYILMSSFTDGQTVGKMLTGIRVVSDDNESFKPLKLTQRLKIHTKRLIFLRGGTKVVKEKDPEVTGL
jgi:uncharacterized RDD family membrane protein YckC